MARTSGGRGAQCNSSEEGRPAREEILASAEVREPARRMALPVRENITHLFPCRKHQLNKHIENA